MQLWGWTLLKKFGVFGKGKWPRIAFPQSSTSHWNGRYSYNFLYTTIQHNGLHLWLYISPKFYIVSFVWTICRLPNIHGYPPDSLISSSFCDTNVVFTCFTTKLVCACIPFISPRIPSGKSWVVHGFLQHLINSWVWVKTGHPENRMYTIKMDQKDVVRFWHLTHTHHSH